MAYKIGGVPEQNTMSTHQRFKPGIPYFYPMLKIHKLRREDLIPGVEPPARLVTSLRDGVAKRSDVFLADRFLKSLEKDYCKDLLMDTSDALRWLDSLNREMNTEDKKEIKFFTFDFKSLYDTLKPALVKEAVKYAMDTCRPDWSDDLKNWILALIDFSLRASVAKYDDNWWKQKNGIPTGGSLCVQLANITVYFVMSQKVYDKPDKMINVAEVKRFIDDGAGLYSGSQNGFEEWLRMVNSEIGEQGLNIDESSLKNNSEFINFLDIQYCFNSDGELQTDLYIKETDSRSYLNFASAHPNYTFSGTVYSQCLRLRRIINDQERLRKRLEELGSHFKKAGYPDAMVQNITNKVLNSERDISIKEKNDRENNDRIRVVSTFMADERLMKAVKDSEESLKLTQSFRQQRGPLFSYVKKVGANIRSHVNGLKQQALGTKRGTAEKCNGRGCKTCKMLLRVPKVIVGKKTIKLSKGSCKSNNICYIALCDICKKPYTGRTVDFLHARVTGHRSHYKEVLKKTAENEELDLNSDLYQLGLHLHFDHGFTEPEAFDQHIKFGILEVVNPVEIDKKEFKWMHNINSFQPHGINVEYPFGISKLTSC